MSFSDFILQFSNDDTLLRSLAKYILDDIHFPCEEENNKRTSFLIIMIMS